MCHVVSATEVKYQLTKFTESVDDVMGQIASVVKTLGMIQLLEVSMAVLAKYSVDRAWYRAVVLSVNDEEVQVEFVDYGNSESVQKENIRSIPAEFVALPKACITVSLYDVYSEDVDIVKTKEYLELTYLEREVNLEIVEKHESRVSAYMYASGQEFYINDMIYKHFAVKELPKEDVPAIVTSEANEHAV